MRPRALEDSANPLDCFVGIDLGTSGCRICAIDETGREIDTVRTDFPPPARKAPGHSEQEPRIWWGTVSKLLSELTARLPTHILRALSVDGTSGTLLVTDKEGEPLGSALMYDDCRARAETARIQAVAGTGTAASSATASLAKLLWLLENSDQTRTRHALHQSEWITGKLLGSFTGGDENNCLKLGFDPVSGCWPGWMEQLDIPGDLLPVVHPVGEFLGYLDKQFARLTGLSEDCLVIAGTTDSTAATLAAGVSQPGEAVTSLGSTLVLKIVSDRPIVSAGHGVYSHRVYDYWLVGGASNSGGAVLKQYFSEQEMISLSERLQPEHATGLDYYPLPRPGERFPHNDAEFAPRIHPVPEDGSRFFQGLLEGIARIEQDGYRLLHQLGAPEPRAIVTTGGGSRNEQWRQMREGMMGIPVSIAEHQEAAYGSALIARDGYRAVAGSG